MRVTLALNSVPVAPWAYGGYEPIPLGETLRAWHTGSHSLPSHSSTSLNREDEQLGGLVKVYFVKTRTNTRTGNYLAGGDLSVNSVMSHYTEEVKVRWKKYYGVVNKCISWQLLKLLCLCCQVNTQQCGTSITTDQIFQLPNNSMHDTLVNDHEAVLQLTVSNVV